MVSNAVMQVMQDSNAVMQDSNADPIDSYLAVNPEPTVPFTCSMTM